MTVRLVGVGNPLRGDDAAGLEVAHRVEGALGGAGDIRRCSRGAAALLEAWEGAAEVVVVDAVRTGGTAGSIVQLSATEAAAARWATGTHDAGLPDALALAAVLGRLPPIVRVIGIEGRSFALGTDLTAEVAAAVERLAEHLVRELGGAPTHRPANRVGPQRP